MKPVNLKIATRPDMAAASVLDKMTPQERRTGAVLAMVFSLRMLGLFLVLPVFALYAHTLPGGDDVRAVGFALGVFGLTQAFLQIPFGMASDRFGRKPVIVFGLLLFVAGSVWAALADSLASLTAARVLQGAGAISAAVTALAADLTREQHRTKVMAMIGSSIGLTFAGSLVAAPLLFGWIGGRGLFWLIGALALAAIVLVWRAVPAEPDKSRPAMPTRFAQVLRHPQLLRLNFGVFALHLMQTALWVVVPTLLLQKIGLDAGAHWQVYLPAVLISFVVMVPAIIVAERRQKMRPIMLAAIGLLTLVQFGLWLAADSVWSVGLWLTLFFVGFNVLEATQPSLISRWAPGDARGAAMGLYNTTQSVGLFLGGALGGLLLAWQGAVAVHLFCAVLAALWWWLTRAIRQPGIPAAAAAANDPQH